MNEEREERERVSSDRVSPVFPRAEDAVEPDGRVNEKEVMPEHHDARTSRGRNWENSASDSVCSFWRYSTPHDGELEKCHL